MIRVIGVAVFGLLPLVLGVGSWLHGAAGGAGTGGRPFVIFLAVVVGVGFALAAWDGAR